MKPDLASLFAWAAIAAFAVAFYVCAILGLTVCLQ